MSPIKAWRLAPFFALVAGCGADPVDSPAGAVRGNASAVEPNMVQARAFHTASVLADGAVLLSGGIGGDPEVDGTTPSWGESIPLDTLELFDPKSEDFCRFSQRFSRARYSHTATELADGDVLFVGGTGRYGDLATADRYHPTDTRCPDPACDLSPAGAMAAPRSFHSATRLETGPFVGSVLLVGGWTGGPPALRTAELYDPSTNTIGPLVGADGVPSELLVARAAHAAIRLESGRILFVGGRGVDGQATATAELFEPATGRFTRTGDLREPLVRPTVTLLEGDCVLVVGGHDGDYEPLPDVERFEPCPGLCTCPDGVSPEGRFVAVSSTLLGRRGHTASRLDDGRVLVVGGLSSSAELYADEHFAYAGEMLEIRGRHTATVLAPSPELPGGGVLVAGGLADGKGRSLATAEIFDSAAGEFRRASGARCSDTSQSAIVGDSVVDCGGLLCRSGRCLSFCETSLDCAPGRVCRADGSCAEPPAGEATTCAVGPRGDEGSGSPGALLLCAAAFGIRRAQRRYGVTGQLAAATQL